MFIKKLRPVKTLILLLIFLLSLLFLRFAFNVYEKNAYPRRHQETVSKFSKELGFDESLIYAIIHTESNFKEDALSGADAKGLMQVTEITKDWVNFRFDMDENSAADLFNPATSIEYGVKTLYLLRERFTSLPVQLAAYNAGYSTVEDWLSSEYSADGMTLKSIPYPETSDYIEKVLKAEKKYRKLYYSP